MKKLFENWRRYVNESAEPDHLSDEAELAIHPEADVEGEKFFGSCGMFAIALGEEALRRGKKVGMVVAHNAEDLDDLLDGEPDVLHVAAEIDGTIYDGRGKVSSVDNLLDFIDVPPANIAYLELDEAFKRLVRTQTNWSVTCEEYADEASQFLDKLGGENETFI